MRIDVTTTHLERGIPADPCGCPVALAVREALAARGILPDRVTVTFARIGIKLSPGLEGEYLPTPVLAGTFLDAYDHNRRGIAPFSFDLDVTALGLAGVA